MVSPGASDIPDSSARMLANVAVSSLMVMMSGRSETRRPTIESAVPVPTFSRIGATVMISPGSTTPSPFPWDGAGSENTAAVPRQREGRRAGPGGVDVSAISAGTS